MYAYGQEKFGDKKFPPNPPNPHTNVNGLKAFFTDNAKEGGQFPQLQTMLQHMCIHEINVEGSSLVLDVQGTPVSSLSSSQCVVNTHWEGDVNQVLSNFATETDAMPAVHVAVQQLLLPPIH